MLLDQSNSTFLPIVVLLLEFDRHYQRDTNPPTAIDDSHYLRGDTLLDQSNSTFMPIVVLWTKFDHHYQRDNSRPTEIEHNYYPRGDK